MFDKRANLCHVRFSTALTPGPTSESEFVKMAYIVPVSEIEEKKVVKKRKRRLVKRKKIPRKKNSGVNVNVEDSLFFLLKRFESLTHND
jgi:hypothetical protein